MTQKIKSSLISRLILGFRKFFGTAPPDNFLIENKYRVELAFIIKGQGYYWCPDQSEMPTGRALAALSIYEEMRMGTTKEYLEYHCSEVDKILNKTRPSVIELSRLVTLHKHLKERSQLMILPDYIYKLASVVFMRQDESPYSYDWKINGEKIALFKKHGDLSFFLNSPLKTLIPSLSLPEVDIEKYLEAVQEIDRIHWEFLINELSKNPSTLDTQNSAR